MAGKPQVTLTLAGDASKLEQVFSQVGSSSKKMADEVGASSRTVADETTDSFARADDAAGQTYDKFDALESVGRGTTDTMSGLGEIMSGNVLQGSTDLAGGVAALADGFSGALLPAIKAMSVQSLRNTAAAARNTVATYANRGAQLAAAGATRVMTVAQKAMNLAMRLNPVGILITALVLLGVGLVAAYRKSATFRAVVNGALGGVKAAFHGLVVAGQAVYGWFRNNIPKIGGFFRSVGGAIAAPWRAAFNGIRSAWNNTVGGRGFSIPGWVPGLGGKDFRIPYFHSGGIVPGGLGSESLAVLRAGERVSTAGGGGPQVVFMTDGSRTGELLLQILKDTVRPRGGLEVAFK